MQYNIVGFILFAFVTCITPGPNNLLLFSSGSSRGFKRSIPLMAGISSGFFTLLCLSGYGIGALVTSNPNVKLVFKILSTGWLVYLAWKVRHVGRVSKEKKDKPMGYTQGFLFQFVNSKAWVMAVGSASAFLPDFGNIHLNVLFLATVYNLIGIPSMMVWVTAGNLLSKLLKTEKSRMITGWVLFGLMLLSAATIWL